MNRTTNGARLHRAAVWLLIASLAIYALVVLLLSSVPVFSRDAIIHHLAIPKLYLEHGGMVELPQYFFSYYPQLLELIYILPVWAGLDFTAKYIHFLFGILTAWLIFWYIRRTIGVVWGLMGALLFVTIPLILKLSVTVYVDLGLVFFSTGALLASVLWLEDRRRKWLIIAAISCGLALSVKYNGLLTFLILLLCLPLFYLRSLPPEERGRQQMAAMKHAALFAFIALLVFSPWMIRNLVWTGNPLYPLFKSTFSVASKDAGKSESSEEVKPRRSLSHFWYRRHLYQESTLETIGIPIRIFFQGEDDNPALFDGRLDFALLLFPFLLLLGRRPREMQIVNRLMLVFSCLYILLVYLTTDMRVRYVGPAIPPLVILAVFGLHALWSKLSGLARPRWETPVVAVLFIAALTPNLFYLVDLWKRIDPFAYLSGRVSRVEFLSEKVPSFAPTHYINLHLPEESRVLAVYLRQRPYYFEREVGFDYQPFLAVLATEDTAAIQRYLANEQITHLLIRIDLFDHWLSERPEATRRRVLRFFSDHLRLLHVVNGYGVYSLR